MLKKIAETFGMASTPATAGEQLQAAKVAKSEAELAYSEALRAPDGKEGDKAVEMAAAALAVAQRAVERAEARLADAGKREQAEAERKATHAKAEGQRNLDRTLAERTKIGSRIEDALSELEQALQLLDANDAAITALQRAGHVSPNLAEGYNYAGPASRDHLRAQFDRILHGPSSTPPQSVAEWIAVTVATAKTI